MGLARCQANTLGLSYVLNLNAYRSCQTHECLGSMRSHVLSLNAHGFGKMSGQYPWAQLCAKPKCLWVQQDVIPNFIGLGYALSLSTHGFSKTSGPTSLGSTTCLTQMLVGLVRYQTQFYWTWLRAEPMCLWVLKDIRPNIHGISYVFSLNIYASNNMLDPTLLGSTTR